ncbi:MAG: ATP-binding protein [Jaaginema sp. PMC 1079.18]|nr:ATP-binding protein [Jaaginema sp. PMC 1080.18]MEC4850632.1 ATP-binding protein [Jaaginema sp. PMC 1079.18]MEC4866302.1 ATP-binding protein [Jaaginema sp. PMC 1078.18]
MIPSIDAYFQGHNLYLLYERVGAETISNDCLLLLGFRSHLAALLNYPTALSATEYYQLCQTRQQPGAWGWYQLLAAQRLYWRSRPQAAYDCLQEIKAAIIELDEPEITTDYHFYCLLCLAVQPDDAPLLRLHHQALQKMVGDRPQWQYKLDLANGAIASDDSALADYDKAIALLQPQNLNPYLALSYQLLAQFWQKRNLPQQSAIFQQQALQAYQDWGAVAIVKHFQLPPRGDRDSELAAFAQLSSCQDWAEACTLALALCLDFLPAQKGAIFLYQNDQWQVQTAFPENGDWPLVWWQTLAQTPEIKLLSPVFADWPDDPYFQQYQPQQAWGWPLRVDTEVFGMLYLEREVMGLSSQPALLKQVVTLLEQQYQRDRLQHQLVLVQERAIAQERFASLGALTAGIAHEIKNPLNFVNNFAELSLELTQEIIEELETQQAQINPETWDYLQEIFGDLNQNLRSIDRHGKRADSIIRSMLLHSRSSKSDPCVAVDLNALLAEYVNLAYHGMRAKDSEFNITIESHYDSNLKPIQAVPQNLSRAFLNLINNACHATRDRVRQEAQNGNSNYRPLLTVTTQDLGKTVEIRIRDNGTGIPPHIQQRIFEPFFTTKPTGIGTGLGLSISRDIIIKEHQGHLEIDTVVNQYTEFILTLPKH